ncbi:hypothetical protein ACFVWN_04640 [Nocardiopsis flavescens]|uniref:hypothetical protein n=1 Tax=Nocardiopsis flavescens TaxID=758803 RepID=UPI0036566F28
MPITDHTAESAGPPAAGSPSREVPRQPGHPRRDGGKTPSPAPALPEAVSAPGYADRFCDFSDGMETEQVRAGVRSAPHGANAAPSATREPGVRASGGDGPGPYHRTAVSG